MKQTNVLSIKYIDKSKNEKWVRIVFRSKTWIPELLNVTDILSKIYKCEDLKYPNGEGGERIRRFINKCLGKKRSEIEKILFEEFDENDVMKQRYRYGIWDFDKIPF